MDANFLGLFLLEQVQCDMTEDSEILRTMILAHPTLIFPKGNIKDPMESVLDSPMPARHAESLLGTVL